MRINREGGSLQTLALEHEDNIKISSQEVVHMQAHTVILLAIIIIVL
jgi:hypothetical protein